MADEVEVNPWLPKSPERLNDCTQGDWVAVRWAGPPFDRTEQVVIYCGPIGHGLSGRRQKKARDRDNSAQWAMVETVDLETMAPHKTGVGRRFNAYVVGNLEVICVVRPSPYKKLTGEQQRRIETMGDSDDPLMRRGGELARAAGRGEL